MIVLGIGLGSTMPIFTLAVQSAFGKERLGEVTAGSQLFRSIGGTVGTAVLAGVMNSRLSAQAGSLMQEPFVQQMQQLHLNSGSDHFDATMIQAVLNHDNQQHIRQLLSNVPANLQPQVNQQFDQFIQTAKVTFSHAVDGVFLVAACLMMIALVFVFFLPELPLRRSDHTAMEETGIMLEDELGQSDKEAQPRVMDPARLSSL